MMTQPAKPSKNEEARLLRHTASESQLNELAKLAAIIADSDDAIITESIESIVTSWNASAERIFGYGADEIIGKSITILFPKDRIDEEKFLIKKIENNLQVKHHETERVNKAGKRIQVSVSLLPIKNTLGEIVGISKIVRDMTAQRKMADEISYRATHDMLTGLLNRGEFEKKLYRFINDHREADLQNALVYIDLDRFKVINDSCGHSAGDIVLKDVAKIMHACIRSTDTLARIDGDEFAVILYKCDTKQAMKIAKSICKSVEEYHFYQADECFRIGASIGLVMIDKNWASTTSLMQAADNACYKAKNTGRNRVHIYYDDDSLVSAHRGEIKWVSRIEKALEDKSFVLFCQRIMPLKHQGLEHAEILIRMVDKDGTLIPPSAFLPAAERFHIASRIDRFVVAEVLEWMQVNKHALSHIESISVNLSGQSLSDPTFHRYVLDLISSVLIDCSKLCFEITETAAITNIVDAKKFIAEISQYGVKFALDDFGSGVSSFGYLKNLDVDYLKIDGQFITDLMQNDIGQATVRCIAEVAKATGKKTIAEWVENKTVENLLKKMGVDFTQGYLKHNPAPLSFLLETSCSYACSQLKNNVVKMDTFAA